MENNRYHLTSFPFNYTLLVSLSVFCDFVTRFSLFVRHVISAQKVSSPSFLFLLQIIQRWALVHTVRLNGRLLVLFKQVCRVLLMRVADILLGW